MQLHTGHWPWAGHKCRRQLQSGIVHHAVQAACIACCKSGQQWWGQLQSPWLQHAACIISASSSRHFSPVVIWSEANIVAPSSDLLQVCTLEGAVVTDLNLILLASPATGACKTLITGKA